ncbi:hypothetical protein BH10PSE19_BH10PSE19_13500 [soil metagenome]
MQIQLNGQQLTLLTGISLQDFLEGKGYNGDYFSVALNYTFVPRCLYVKTLLKEGDSLEVVMPMQGG